MKKEYSNGELTVVWEAGKCIHAANCAKGLPSVFKPKEKPWIAVDQATTKELVNQIDQCPSGALSYYYNNSEKANNMKNEEIKVQVLPNGPVLIKGAIEITHANGKIESKENQTAICRCGASSNKPFCDGTHGKIGFTD